jgi:hypothetical protein
MNVLPRRNADPEQTAVRSQTVTGNAAQKFRGQTNSVSEIESCTLYVVGERWILGLHIAVHVRKKSFLRHTAKLSVHQACQNHDQMKVTHARHIHCGRA